MKFHPETTLITFFLLHLYPLWSSPLDQPNLWFFGFRGCSGSFGAPRVRLTADGMSNGNKTLFDIPFYWLVYGHPQIGFTFRSIIPYIKQPTRVLNTAHIATFRGGEIIMYWVHLLLSKSHHYDDYIFTRASRTKPSFTTVTGLGVDPNHAYRCGLNCPL